jgi:hypothetical protein
LSHTPIANPQLPIISHDPAMAATLVQNPSMTSPKTPVEHNHMIRQWPQCWCGMFPRHRQTPPVEHNHMIRQRLQRWCRILPRCRLVLPQPVSHELTLKATAFSGYSST